MYSQSFQLSGYEPAWTAEQRGKAENQIAVQDGENFFWNLRGVQSGFGVLRTEAQFTVDMRHPSIMWVENRKVIFTGSGAYEVNGTALINFTANVTHAEYDLGAYKWTYAYVGTRHWFCHPQVNGLVWYDEFDKVWGIYRDDCWTGPNYAVTHADNRLVVLLEDTVIWSKFDEGHIFDCGWQCGSGAQSLALIRYGQPYSVMPYNNGWLTFTSKGIMASVPDYGQTLDPDGRRVVAGPFIYRHDEISFDNLPFGPAAIEHIDEKQVLWLSNTGFWQFSGSQGGGFGAVQPYAPAMGRFYHETLVPAMTASGNLLDTFALHYARDLQWLFVSSRTGLDFGYSRAHVYQTAMERWGSFNFPHLFIGFGRNDGEIPNQLVYRRHFGTINETGGVVIHDPMKAHVRAWVKFTPMRLQIPQEDVLVETMTSVQGIRLGIGSPDAATVPNASLRSSWVVDQIDEERHTHFHLMVSSGTDATTEWPDEQTYAQQISRTRDIATYSCHSTGVNHVLTATALEPDQHFDIRHIEMSYFFAGVK